MRGVCPNCDGELVPRPRRAVVVEAVTAEAVTAAQ
jgi:hypothetical protein